MNKEELEKLCKRCGKCCREKFSMNGTVYIFMNSPCSHLLINTSDDLNKGKMSCDCYEDRKGKCMSCLSIEEAIEKGVLPEDCGYKELFPKEYRPAREVSSIRDINIL